MHVTIRWIRADLRARPGQAVLLTGVVAGVVAALILSITLLGGALNPWQGLFTRSHGAHVWIYTVPGTDLRPLSQINGVTATTGPYQAAATTLIDEGQHAPLELRAMGPTLPSVSRPLLVSGHWLNTARPNGVVLERSFARAFGVRVGMPITIQGLNTENTHVLSVIGIADTADQGPYPASPPGLAWTLPAAFRSITPQVQDTEQLVGLRLADPNAARISVPQQVVDLLGQSHVERMTLWTDVRTAMEADNKLLGLLLGLFGVVALVAAALAIGNATGGRVLAQLPDIALLKVSGVTRAQVTAILLVEQCALGLVGVLIGSGCARILTGSWLEQQVFGSVTQASTAPLSFWSLISIAAAAEFAVALATLIPAWQGSRVSPLAVVSSAPPSGRLSRIARVALVVRLPAALVLGVRDAFTRRLRALLTIGALAILMVMVTIGLGCLATLNNFTGHPSQIGLAASFTATPTVMDPGDTQSLLDRDPGVSAVYPEIDDTALVPGATQTIQVRAIGTSQNPYPFPIRQGRLYSGLNQAVAGQGLLDMLHVNVGARVRLTIEGHAFEVDIVGRTIEPVDNGVVLSMGTDTFSEFLGSRPPTTFAVVLRHGTNPAEVRSRVLAASGGGIGIQPVVNPADRLSVVRVAVVVLVVILALIGLANVSTAANIGLRDHLRDIGVLRAIGLTPRQVTATMVIGAGVLALIAAVLGTGVGLALSGRLIDLQGRDSGIGAGIARSPSAVTLVVSALVACMIAMLTAFLRSRDAVRADISTALRT
jgi:putative ABC transport system permease protein